jgi:two-component system nitrogen regulation response regulator NtrX
MDGLEVLQKLRHLVEVTPIVVISGHGDITTAVEATRLGAFDFIEKPLERERVLVTVRNAVDTRRLKTENKSYRRDAEKKYQIVGDSPTLAAVRSAIQKAAPTNATVLIWGESGVGKELVARAIHRESLRRDGAFVQVNCAAIPDELIESELFGHEKGSFTGATDRQIGKFEQADKGTIFLDEIGDMSLKTQAKVLRVLQEQELERLGSNKVIKVDVRVIAATNKNLEEEIDKNTFREDLFYRLNVVPIHVPALRERRDDIPALVRHFADLFARDNNFRRKTFTAPAMEKLKQQHWRGNIRELRNFVERLVIMTTGDSIDARDIPEGGVIRGDLPILTPGSGDAVEASPSISEQSWMQAPTLQEFKSGSERAYLVAKLRENGWNISKTAEVIDTPRSNLYKKLEQYQISQEKDG